LKNAKSIVFSLVILLAIPTAIVFAVAWLNSCSTIHNWSNNVQMHEEITTNWGSYDSKENAIFVNCTLIKGYNGTTECILTKFTLDNYRGRVFEGTPVPTKLLLNETTTVKLNLGSPLPPEIYNVQLMTSNRGSVGTSLNIGNFVDPQEQIEVKEIFYDKTTNILFVECNRIYGRTDLSVVIKDNQSANISLENFDRPVRIDIPPNATQLRISPQEPLVPGQYCLYLVTPKGLITQFTVP
jgi:hypothetical protein